MSEEVSTVIGKKDLTWFIAQTNADIVAIDAEVLALQSKAEGLRAEQVELVKVLKKLEAPDVAEVAEVAEPEEPVIP